LISFGYLPGFSSVNYFFKGFLLREEEIFEESVDLFLSQKLDGLRSSNWEYWNSILIHEMRM